MLGYNVNFKLINAEGGVIRKWVDYQCYNPITFQGLPRTTSHIILWQPVSSVDYTEQEFVRWLNDIKGWGFPLEYLGIIDNSYHIKIPIKIGDKQYYKGHLKLTSVLILIRYPFENHLDRLLQRYFEICDLIGKNVNKFAAMQVAHLYIDGNTNHSLRLFEPMKLIKLKDIRAKFNEHEMYSIYLSDYKSVSNAWAGNKIRLTQKILENKKATYYILLRNKLPKDKVYVVGHAKEYANWLPNIVITNKLEEADCVLFTGGEDVDPALYGEKRGVLTHCNPERDKMEQLVFKQAKQLNKKMLGICRGSQFLCVMAGGKLVQHQRNVPEHPVFTYDDNVINITSTHHQAAMPNYGLSNTQYKILAWTQGISDYHLDGNGTNMVLQYNKEAEIVKYNNINALGIQGHPEFEYYQNDPANKESLDYLKDLFIKFMNNKI